MLTVGEFMTREVKTLRADQLLLDALTFLHAERVRHIPILADGELVGVVTDRDVKRATPSALVPSQRAVWEQVVKETPLERVMTRDPTTATASMSLTEALRVFVEERIGCLPVLEDGALVGIVTAGDLFRAALQALGASGE